MLAKQQTIFLIMIIIKMTLVFFFYLSLSKLILVLSFMNILSEFQSFDPMYVMLCCSLQFLNMFH